MHNISLEAVKFDNEKPRTDLIPPEAIIEIAEVFAFGAKKYSDRNWEKGMKYHRMYGAALRHLLQFWMGEDKDPETQKSHLAHAGCCILMLLGTTKIHPEMDDRPHKFQEGLKLAEKKVKSKKDKKFKKEWKDKNNKKSSKKDRKKKSKKKRSK